MSRAEHLPQLSLGECLADRTPQGCVEAFMSIAPTFAPSVASEVAAESPTSGTRSERNDTNNNFDVFIPSISSACKELKGKTSLIPAFKASTWQAMLLPLLNATNLSHAACRYLKMAVKSPSWLTGAPAWSRTPVSNQKRAACEDELAKPQHHHSKFL